jgi:hypothetical protein
MESKPHARAAGLGCGLVRVNHLAHPGRLAAEVDIVDTRPGACRHQPAAVELVRPDRAEHQPRLRHQRRQAAGIVGVGHDERRLGGRAQFVAHGPQLGQAAPAHGPAQAAA